MSNPLRCVIDANVGIKRFIADPLTPKVNQLLAHSNICEAQIYIPDLFYIEVTNIFWKYIRARMYTAAEVQADLATLKSLSLRVVSTADLMEEAVNVSYPEASRLKSSPLPVSPPSAIRRHLSKRKTHWCNNSNLAPPS